MIRSGTLVLGLFLGAMNCGGRTVVSQDVIDSYCEVVDVRHPEQETARFFGCDNPYAALAYTYQRGVRGELRARVVQLRQGMGRQYGEWIEFPWRVGE
jgi:hypothetical protein